MRFCSKCGKEIRDEAVMCVHCGCAVENVNITNGANNSGVREDDSVSVSLCVLAALIPLFGVIYWPVKHKSTPKKAMACGITGIVAWVAYMWILPFIFIGL